MNDSDNSLYNIEEEDTDTLYSIEEPEEKHTHPVMDEEDLPYAYGRGDEEEVEADCKKSNPNPMSLIFKVMFGPMMGWKALKRAKIKPEKMGSMSFYPMCALAALSEFANLFFEANQTIRTVLVSALITFIAYFFSFFILPVLGKPFLCKEANESLASDFGKNMLMTLFTTLAMFKIAFNLLPGFDAVVVFLPLWTIYLINRAMSAMRVPKAREAMTTVILSILAIGLPTAFKWLLEMLLHTA